MKLSLALLALAASPLAAEPLGCGFDTGTLSFAGKPVEQARCLLRHVGQGRAMGPVAPLPPTIGALIGTVPAIDSRRYDRFVTRYELQAIALPAPVSRANDNDPSAPTARYFVIHDTSTPWLGDTPFPPGMNDLPWINDITAYATGPDAVAHVFNSRQGVLTIGHDFAVPWRATKLEKRVGLPSKGLFLHIENLQPRRKDGGGAQGNDTIAPVPGFTPVQYRRLAQLYIVASVRAGQWLIPAHHAAIDDGIEGAHDDPQNFDLKTFDAVLGRLVRQLR